VKYEEVWGKKNLIANATLSAKLPVEQAVTK
jgi:hypothetical protein